jgi:hypothetical protein
MGFGLFFIILFVFVYIMGQKLGAERSSIVGHDGLMMVPASLAPFFEDE